MKNETDEIIKRVANEILSSKWLQKQIDQFLNSAPSALSIQMKGEGWADELIKRIETSPLTELIQKYLDAVEEVQKNKRLAPEVKLKKLIPPLNEILKITFPNYLKDHHRFVNDRFIDLENELDLKNLVRNPEKYTILGDGELTATGLLNTRSKNIVLGDQYLTYLAFIRDTKPLIGESEFNKMIKEGKIKEVKVKKTNSTISQYIAPGSGRKSVSEIYKDWLPTLDQEIIVSKDLLTQTLVCYTIKRALNGDEKALKQLYECYEGAAEGFAVKEVAKRLHLGSLWIDEIQQDAKILLRLLIGGFRPDNILNEILRDIRDTSTGAIDAVPKWVKGFYLYYLVEWVPQKLTEIRKKAELIRMGEAMGLTKDRRKVEFDLGLEIGILLNPFTPIYEGAFWQKSPVRKHKFNKYSYKPKKMGPQSNLTLWLFGPQDKPLWGILYQLLMNQYVPIAKKKWAFHKKPLSHDSGEEIYPSDPEEFNEHWVYRKPREEIPLSHFHKEKEEDQEKEEDRIKPSLEEINRKIALLEKAGIIKKDIEIFISWKYGKILQTRLAEKHNLSRRQVIRICNKTKKILSLE